MQGAMVLLMALTGLGCQNPTGEVGHAQRPPCRCRTRRHTACRRRCRATTPHAYPQYYPAPISTSSTVIAPHGTMCTTFCSFFLGRDPDVATADEIEASVYGNGYSTLR